MARRRLTLRQSRAEHRARSVPHCISGIGPFLLALISRKRHHCLCESGTARFTGAGPDEVRANPALSVRRLPAPAAKQDIGVVVEQHARDFDALVFCSPSAGDSLSKDARHVPAGHLGVRVA